MKHLTWNMKYWDTALVLELALLHTKSSTLFKNVLNYYITLSYPRLMLIS